ncbi:MAG: hypothetical protein QOF68_968 [Gaiellales bacterium]|nr:hypothetical protein [Gaiellales bacterium]
MGQREHPSDSPDVLDTPLPTGTVTFLFSDIEGSTRLLKALRGGYGSVLADHERLLREAFVGHDGREIDTQGDSFFVAFARARDAVVAAATCQRSLSAHSWPQGVTVRVRMGIHTGEPSVEHGRYLGLDVHRAARICSAGHGGQVLLSRLTAGLVEEDLPDGVELREVGSVRLKDIDRPERLSQLVISGLPPDFPPLRVDSGDDVVDAGRALGSAEIAGMAARTTPLSVSLLGPVEASRGGEQITIGAQKQRMILAALALRLGDTVPSDFLIDVLWGRSPPPTAVKALQVYVSELRKLLDGRPSSFSVIQSRPGGYRLVIPQAALDLARFEELWTDGRQALAVGDSGAAVSRLRDALSMWRGDPLSDLRYEEAFSVEIARLEDMRLSCIEDQLDAELWLEQPGALVPRIEHLVAASPLRERLRGLLMLALYRDGRQADALAAYRQVRDMLVAELGIDPSPALATLERRILQQDPSLLVSRPDAQQPIQSSSVATRTLLVVSQSGRDLDELSRFAAEVTEAHHDRELVLTRMVAMLSGDAAGGGLAEATHQLSERRDDLVARGIDARVAAFNSMRPGADLVKLANHQDADLILLDGSDALLEGRFGIADELLRDAPCDVALHLPARGEASGGPVLVPFSGSEHDWAALELGVLLCRRAGVRLVMAGAAADDGDDASRLLATASLVIQRTSSVIAEPILVPAGPEGILDLAADARLVIVGLSPRFRERGLGATRHAIARNVPSAVVFVRRGTRPGVLTPGHMATRFAWSVATTWK